ncbi:4'-phosphopantetheinyl transferase family protein [Caulobacter rhizosphaerae]|jgi:4'-phosphopantetheinyl transferase EntD|uniref:4'-phosphopantetheinyl transferase family protein n=1 Tax=Caulobacter rhizosphaerae TaxID=2010972 RepID=UPI0013D44311|nr:4'-phosphopantetheinyl transferase superfamily protein [Caulobacter rhizosphaerae]GGL49644.1 4'-phosphopantetheinyl transferase [Caulobacter rhizosphaerae]
MPPGSALASKVESLFAAPVRVGVGELGEAQYALYPEEAAAVGRATPQRWREFAAGRACARRALGGWNLAPIAVPVGKTRRPIWPDGFTGAIAHTAHLCAAAVAQVEHASSIGLDLEIMRPMPQGSAELVCTPAELAAFEHDAPTGPLLAFCAKEALYKCYNPVADAYLDFQDVEVRVSERAGESGCFGFQFGDHIAGAREWEARLVGRWMVAAGHMIVGVTLLPG